MNTNVAWTVLGLGFLIMAAFLYYAFVPDDQMPPEEVVCTMDARICPDGSAVGRVGPNCEFAACPESGM